MADCNWIDSDIVCKSYELDFAPSVSSVSKALILGAASAHKQTLEKRTSLAIFWLLYTVNYSYIVF